MLPNDCTIVAEPCCGDLFTIADYLLAVVGDAVDSCEAAVCGEMVRYVSMGSYDDAQQNAVCVTFQSADLSPDSIRNGRPLPFTMQRAVFQVSIRESGWPMASAPGQEILTPDPARQHEVARIAFGHGEKAYRELLNRQTGKALLPFGFRCLAVAVGSLTPMRPQAGVVGWIIPVTYDLAWN